MNLHYDSHVGADPMPQPYNCITGVLKQECIDVLQRFYEQENPNGIVFMLPVVVLIFYYSTSTKQKELIVFLINR